MFYFRLHFHCEHCSQPSSRIIKTVTRSKLDAREQLGSVRCHICAAPSELYLIDIEELALKHLEEFIHWAQ